MGYIEPINELAYFDGLMIRWDFSGRLHTHNPVYLLGLFLYGLFMGAILLGLLTLELFSTVGMLSLVLPSIVLGCVVMFNVILSILDQHSEIITGDQLDVPMPDSV